MLFSGLEPGLSADPASTIAERKGAFGESGVRLVVPWDSSVAPAPWPL